MGIKNFMLTFWQIFVCSLVIFVMVLLGVSAALKLERANKYEDFKKSEDKVDFCLHYFSNYSVENVPAYCYSIIKYYYDKNCQDK